MDRRFTYKDYRSWPEDERWELIEGIAYNMCAAPNLNHQDLLMNVGLQAGIRLKGKKCKVYVAPVDVFLPPDPHMNEDDVDTVVEPDILVVCDRSKLRPNGIWGAPDWVVEILSPQTQKKDLAEKFNAYERAGVREYWTIDPGARSLVVYVLERDASGRLRFGDGVVYENPQVITCSAVEGLEIDMAEAFAEMATTSPQ
jgi:Uma2 family endonuclease